MRKIFTQRETHRLRRKSGRAAGWALACATTVALLAACRPARADVAFLMEEPYGQFGNVNPTGHGALYFNHICAETPTQLRVCRTGEQGVVVSRYYKVGGYDWLAVPLMPYLYAVERVEDVPATADAVLRDRLRDEYRRSHLMALAPDTVTKDGTMEAPKGDWIQLVGSSYDRKIYGFQLETTREEDERFIDMYNDHRNVSHFNLFYRNCADFSKTVLNSYFPHAVKKNVVVDFGITTPKQVARSLTKYSKKHPDLPFTVFMIPQVPGSIPRSHKINGVMESLVMSKKYGLPLLVLYPEFTIVLGATYVVDGRFHPPVDADPMMFPGEDARTIMARKEALEPVIALTETEPDIEIVVKASPKARGMEVERVEGDGATHSLGGPTRSSE